MLRETVYSDANHEFARYSADYELYLLGTYDDNTGKLDTHAPAHILNINQIKHEDPPRNGGATEQQVNDLDHKTVAEEALKAVN